nr:hypothetical protein [Acutalibacter muris]
MKKTTKTEYFYNDDERICRSVTTETSDYEDGVLVTSDVDVADDSASLAVVALTLATVSLCITAIGTIFNRR